MTYIIKHWPTALAAFLVGGFEGLSHQGFITAATAGGIASVVTLVAQYLKPPNAAPPVKP